ncbi:MAG: TM0106 family RecB-like putative nuclease [Chitinophagaceae bacterium]|nr:TM0106 family RecB-like putative nuclease [Anaerolineae bacterium]
MDVEIRKPLILSATTLRLFEMCARRIWLDEYGNREVRDEISLITAQILARGVEHEEAIQRATTKQIKPILITKWEDGIRATQGLMRYGASVIMGAHLEHTFHLDGFSRPIVLRGKVDRLVRLSDDDTYRSVYVPIEIKRYAKLAQADLLQLDAYVWLLSQTQGHKSDSEFWLGMNHDGLPSERIRHEYDEDRLMAVLTAVIHQLDPDTAEPPIEIKQHCRTCHWYSACRSITQKRLDVNLLSLREDTRFALRDAGIKTLHQLIALAPDDLRQFKGIKTTAEAIHAHARSYCETKPIWFNELPEKCREKGFFFDIETDPITQEVWSIGWSDGSDEVQTVIVAPTKRQYALALPDGKTIIVVPDADTAWRVFAEGVSGVDSPVYHWSGFDAGMMHRTAPDDVIEQLAGRLYDLLKTFNQCVKFPVRGASLKTVAAYLEFNWSIYASWEAAFRDYNQWLADDDVHYLARACAYQRDDVVALALMWHWLNK